MQIEDLKTKIKYACNDLKNEDKKLFELGHFEETLNHRLAVHLDRQFDEYDVDVEYSLAGKDHKTNQNGDRVRPDIVIHKRGNNNANLAIIECKRFNNNRCDKAKIEKYANLDYKYGVVVKYEEDGNINHSKSNFFEFSDTQPQWQEWE